MNAPLAMQESVDAILGELEAERATNPDLQHALDELKTSANAYRKAEAYYEDEVPEVFASIRLRRVMQATGMDFKVNFARIPVTAVADRLEISSTNCPTDDQATAWIQRTWADNELDLEAPNIMRKACMYGDGYVMVWPCEDDTADDEPVAMDEVSTVSTDGGQPQSISIDFNSPLCMRLFYDPEKPRRKAFAIKRWALPATQQTRVDLYYPDRLEKYVSKPNNPNADAKDLYLFRDDPEDVWPYPNPYGEVPVFHFRTDRPYGTPEHKGFYGTQNAIRKLIVSHMATVDYQAFQQRYALTDAESDTSEAAAGDEDEFAFADTGTGATRQTAESGQSQLNAGPGELWFMRGVKGVGVFPEADPDVFMKPAEHYLRFGAQATDTPVRLFDYARAQLPSGVSQSQADGPFVKKIKNRHLSFGATWRSIWEFGLQIAGFDGMRVAVNWTPPEHVTGLEGWQTVLAQIEAGIPARQAFAEAGYTQEQIVAWLGEEDDDLPARLALLKEIAQVLQALGAATAFDTIPPEQVKALIAAVLDDLTTLQPDPAADAGAE